MVKLKVRKQKVSEKNVKRLEKLAGKAMIGRYDSFIKHALEVKENYKNREKMGWCKAVLMGQAGYWGKLSKNLLEAKRVEKSKDYAERVLLLRTFAGMIEVEFYEVDVLKQFQEYIGVLQGERDLL